MTDFPVPMISLDRVFHVGTLDPRAIGRNSGGSSLEGHCLSVSLCPHAWRYIAKLGGNPLHELKRDSGRFVDVHAVVEGGHLPAVLAWAHAEGLVKDASLWKSWAYDDEAEEWRYQLLPNEDDAWEEAAPDGTGPDGGPAVLQVTVPVGTWKLESITGMSSRPDEDATDGVLLAFAMAQEADGAWWRENLEPEKLSAPRGAIFRERVSGWTAAKIGWAEVDDGEELERFETAKLPKL